MENPVAATKPKFEAKEFFFDWAQKNLELGECEVGRKHPLRKALLMLMLEDASESFIDVPELTSANRISLGSIVEKQRRLALKMGTKGKTPTGRAKDLVEHIYVKAHYQEIYNSYVENIVMSPEIIASEKDHRAKQRKANRAAKKQKRDSSCSSSDEK